MSPEQLLEELHALQLEAMYGSDQPGKHKTLGSKTEEFLVQQVNTQATAHHMYSEW